MVYTSCEEKKRVVYRWFYMKSKKSKLNFAIPNPEQIISIYPIKTTQGKIYPKSTYPSQSTQNSVNRPETLKNHTVHKLQFPSTGNLFSL